MAEHMRAELVVEALEMAIWQRKPDPGLVHHSVQGSQYTSLIFGQACRKAGIDRSMGARGCALDNAVCEAFFASIKREKLNRRSWPSRQAARNAVFTWIEGWYNRRRLHSTLGMRSPVDYENRTLGQPGTSRYGTGPIAQGGHTIGRGFKRPLVFRLDGRCLRGSTRAAADPVERGRATEGPARRRALRVMTPCGSTGGRSV
jgi:hypothetical protein